MLKNEILNDERYNKSDRKDFLNLLYRYNECDRWAKNIFKDVGVLLTSHPGNRAFLKASVESHKKLGYWICLAYDNYLDPERPELDWNSFMPDRDVIDQVDTFILPHHQTWGGVLYPYFWLLRLGVSTMRHFKYIFCSNGDCILEKPENFPQIIELLEKGENDIAVCGWEHDRIFNSTSFLAKSEAIQAVMEHFQKYFIPLKAYEETAQVFGNCEGRMGQAVIDLGLKLAEVENPFNTQMHEKGHGTWYDILGFRHIHAEYGYSQRNKLIPPEIEYFDKRYLNPKEYRLIETYWKTKDKKYLEEWWEM